MYLTKEENKISNDFLKKGYLIFDIKESRSYQWVANKVTQLAVKFLKKPIKIQQSDILDNIHKYLDLKDLNNFRMSIINEINKSDEFKVHYFSLAKDIIYMTVGNELAMQKKINLSIQLPNDDSSLLPVHSDIWSGDSPFEIVVWLPLVDCFETKSMFILPPQKYKKLEKSFKKVSNKSSESLYRLIKNDVKWINIKSGQVLIFNQSLPHGNRVNIESTSRWSMNCRFKSLLSPYGDKKLGEFFIPITTRVATNIGIDYKEPKL
ncbi:2OG-Fe(II) oxygenase [bacterium]|nr:2OG-Fe(II) oxygenase [bacterium]